MTVVTGLISGLETPTEERTVSAINHQHPECTPPSLSHQGPEKAVEFKEVAETHTTNESNGDQDDLSCAVPNTPSLPLGEQKESVVNQDPIRGNTTSDTLKADIETIRGSVVLEDGSGFPNPPEVESTYSAGQETTSRELSKRKSESESASRTTIASTERQQKPPEPQVLLGSSSESKDGRTDAQVSNMHKYKTPKFQFLPFRFSRVKKVTQVTSEREYCHIH